MSDVLALFLADLNRAADGLKQSLALGSAGTFHASLHARDLGDSLYGVDLGEYAKLAIDISRYLTKGLPGLETPARDLLALVADAAEKVASGVAPHDLPRDPRLAEITQKLSAFEEPPLTPDPSLSGESSPLTQSKSDAQEQVFVWQGAGSSEALKRDVANDLITEALKTANQQPFDGIADQKIFLGLARVKAIELDLGSFLPIDAARHARYALSDHADWLVGLGQFSLERVLAGFCERITAVSVGVDAEIATALQQSFQNVGRVQEISATLQQMTVCLRAIGVADAQSALLRLSRLMGSISGRAQAVNGGFELVFPASLKRLRVVPFRRENQLYAVSWAQFLSAQTLPTNPAAKKEDQRLDDGIGSAEGARLCLELKSGQHACRLYASEVMHFQIANVFRIADPVRIESWVRGLLIGQDSEPALWVDPERL